MGLDVFLLEGLHGLPSEKGFVGWNEGPQWPPGPWPLSIDKLQQPSECSRTVISQSWSKNANAPPRASVPCQVGPDATSWAVDRAASLLPLSSYTVSSKKKKRATSYLPHSHRLHRTVCPSVAYARALLVPTSSQAPPPSAYARTLSATTSRAWTSSTGCAAPPARGEGDRCRLHCGAGRLVDGVVESSKLTHFQRLLSTTRH
jgi:hypothetical protein